MRIFLAFLVLALALGGAVWLVSYEGGSETIPGDRRGQTPNTTVSIEAGWEDPLAVVLAVAGVGAFVAIIVSDRRRSSA